MKGLSIGGGVGLGCLLIPVMITLVAGLAWSCSPDIHDGDDPYPPSTGSASASPAEPVEKIGAYENIDLSGGYFIQFLKDPEHPREFHYGETNDIADLEFKYRYLDTDLHDLAELPAGSDGTYEECRDTTRYVERVKPEDVESGMVCVSTEEGVVALVEIDDWRTDVFVRFDLTLWKGPERGGD